MIKVAKETSIDNHFITIALSESDFEKSKGRKPENQEEFDAWAGVIETGLEAAELDWKMIYECTKEIVPRDKEADGKCPKQ